MAFPVFLDTCALYPATLADLLLRVAERGAYRPHWSADVLSELERNLAKIPSVTEEAARRRVSAMGMAFPDAAVTGYQSLIDGMTCDPKDRHVLAAAVHSDCQLIVTFNVREPTALSTCAPGLAGEVGSAPLRRRGTAQDRHLAMDDRPR